MGKNEFEIIGKNEIETKEKKIETIEKIDKIKFDINSKISNDKSFKIVLSGDIFVGKTTFY